MNDYFQEYLHSKFCLYKMVIQFISTRMPIEEAKERNINIEDSGFIMFNKIDICYHNYTSDGLLAWDYLNLDKDYVTHEEIWELTKKLKDEEYNDEIDYYEEYLKICTLIIDLTLEHYSNTITLDCALRNNVKYDPELDEDDRKIDVCYHMYESAGEHVWNLFDIEGPMIARSEIENLRKDYTEKLSKRRKEKNKGYTKILKR